MKTRMILGVSRAQIGEMAKVFLALVMIAFVAAVIVILVFPRERPRIIRPEGLGFSLDVDGNRGTERVEGDWSEWRVSFSLNQFNGTTLTIWRRQRPVSFFEDGRFLCRIVEAEEVTALQESY